jgi:hypothetical protein
MLTFFFITIAAEGVLFNKESTIRFFMYTGVVTGLLLLIDKALVPKLMHTKRYGLFVLLLLLSIVLTLLIIQQTDQLLFGPSVGNWNDILLGNALFILPWVVIALCILIAEDYGRLNLEKTRNELLFLRHQLNPHFLLNTHNNIHFLIEQDPQLASQTLLQLSGIMQYMLYECAADKVPVKKEMKNLVNYINLERIRKEPTLQITHNLDNITTTKEMAPLLLISFVENAFKHVSNHKDQQNAIYINAEITGDVFRFFVQNTKDGSNTVNERSGIGLKNVQQRLKLLYPKKHNLIIKEEEEGVHAVSLTIQLN